MRMVKWIRRGAPGGNAAAKDAAELVRKGRIKLDGYPLTGVQRIAWAAARRSFERYEAFIRDDGTFDTERFGKTKAGKLHHAPIAGVTIENSRRRSSSSKKCAGCGEPVDGPPGKLPVDAPSRRGTWHSQCAYQVSGRSSRSMSTMLRRPQR